MLGKTGAPIRARAMMYKVVVQSVILYGNRIWVVMDEMMMVLEEFYHRIDRQIAGKTEKKGYGEEWEWASVNTSLETTGMWPIREYVMRLQSTI